MHHTVGVGGEQGQEPHRSRGIQREGGWSMGGISSGRIGLRRVKKPFSSCSSLDREDMTEESEEEFEQGQAHRDREDRTDHE